MSNGGLIYTYQSALQCVEIGPVNISGVQHDMQRWIDQAEADLIERSPELTEVNKSLRKACDEAWGKSWSGELKGGTNACNRYPAVAKAVRRLNQMCYETEHLNRVASHPLVRLPVCQLAQLAGIISNDPLYQTRFGEAYNQAKDKLQELLDGTA